MTARPGAQVTRVISLPLCAYAMYSDLYVHLPEAERLDELSTFTRYGYLPSVRRPAAAATAKTSSSCTFGHGDRC